MILGRLMCVLNVNSLLFFPELCITIIGTNKKWNEFRCSPRVWCSEEERGSFVWKWIFSLWLLSSVFECAYAQLVLPWYGVPEQREQQPLHQVLSGEFNFVIDRIIDRTKDFDVCQAVVGSVRILTQHLHNAKQADRWRLLSLWFMLLLLLNYVS